MGRVVRKPAPHFTAKYAVEQWLGSGWKEERRGHEESTVLGDRGCNFYR